MEKEDNILEKMRLSDQASVPEGYFEQLSARVIDRVKDEPRQKKLHVVYKRSLFWLSTAAACLLVFFGSRFFTNESSSLTFEDLSDSEILAYVEDNLEDIDVLLLVADVKEENKELIQVESISTDTKENKLVDAADSISKDDVLDYLNDEDLYLEDIEEVYL